MFPFGRGLHEENDPRLQDPGTPRAMENLVRTKNGRLKARRDYETIAMTGVGSTSPNTGTLNNLRLYDIAEFGDRLVGFGRADSSVAQNHSTDSTQDIFDLVEQPTGNWRRAQYGELGQGTWARLCGRLGRKVESIEVGDIAADGGRVCTVFQAPLSAGGAATVGVHVFEAARDSTIISAGLTGAEKPRVIVVGGIFFIASVLANGSVQLHRFNPASDTGLVALTSPIGVGASVTAIDMATSDTGTSFWLGIARSDTTTVLRGLSTAGAVTYSAAGPAVLASGITVFHQSTAGTARLHVLTVLAATGAVNASSYVPPSTTPFITTADIFGSEDSLSQVSLCMDPDLRSSSTLMIATFETESNNLIAFTMNVSTHAVSVAYAMDDTPINSKSSPFRNRLPVLALIEEDDGYFTHGLLRVSDYGNNSLAYRPVCVLDHFLAHAFSRFHLPSMAHDTSTDMTYVMLSSEDIDRVSNLQVLEIRLAGTERRQTAQLSDVLYISGAIPQAYDGRHAQEAGGFLTRPFIASIAGNPSGSLDDPGLYYVICLAEYRDAKNRRIQSAPSGLGTYDNSTGADGPGIGVGVQMPLTMRTGGSVDVITPAQFQPFPTFSFYRTLNALEGNGTFHLDESLPVISPAFRTPFVQFLTNSDVAISSEEILYTQGARGALSGPLEFVAPLGCVTMAASADRILTGNLPEESRFQESRPLFPGEQVQWNDTLGFFRDVRARSIGVARLDERRILFTSQEIFESDGPGLDDNGLGDIGAPRRLPSDVGLYGGVEGWRSIVEISAGILFQGLANQIYLLPRGGVTPVPIGFAVEDTLARYPEISAAVYLNDDQTVRFCCNNVGGTESIILLFNVRFTEWFIEGPYAFTIRSAAKLRGQFVMLTSDNTLLRQRTSDTPLTFVPIAWRACTIHPWTAGYFGRLEAIWLYATYRGNCRVRCVIKFDERDQEVGDWVDVFEQENPQFVYRFTFDQVKCESFEVDFEVIDFQGEASQGLELTYWSYEGESSKVPNQVGPEAMS